MISISESPQASTLRSVPFLTDSVFDQPAKRRESRCFPIGVLEGEGIGADVISGALEVLRAVEKVTRAQFELHYGGTIGSTAEKAQGTPLPGEVVHFCESMFERGAPILNGPGGGRFVYDLRRRFDLFCKLAPLAISPALVDANHLRPERVRGLDILIVRENSSGVYQGTWSEQREPDGELRATHTFSYASSEVRRIISAGARLAARRRGGLTVVVKDGGIPALSNLWRACATEIASEGGVELKIVNVDLAAYLLIQHPEQFDVVVCPNLFGDIIADLGAVLIGSRGLSYSGNFAADGRAVYQTNHGAGYDLMDRDMANPIAQILSLAMLLRESLRLTREATLVEDAVEMVLRQGWRTFDLAQQGEPVIGTREMGRRIAAAVPLCDAPTMQ